MRAYDHKVITDTPEWALFISKLADIERDYINEMVMVAKEGDIARVQFLAGAIDQLRGIKDLPEQWMPSPRN